MNVEDMAPDAFDIEGTGPRIGKGPTGCLNTTRCPYPSQSRLDFTQFLHIGFSSPHLILRFLHATAKLVGPS